MGHRSVGPASVGLVLFVLLVAACSSGSAASSGSKSTTTVHPSAPASTGATTASTAAPPPTAPQDVPSALFTHGWPQGSGGACDGHTPGHDGVLMTFCHGPATATVTLPDGPHVLQGVCWFNGTTLELDAGTTVGAGFVGPWPDYVTIQLPNTLGAIDSDFVAFVGGGQHLVQTADGTLAAAGVANGTTLTAADLTTKAVTADASGDSTQDKATISLHATCH